MFFKIKRSSNEESDDDGNSDDDNGNDYVGIGIDNKMQAQSSSSDTISS